MLLTQAADGKRSLIISTIVLIMAVNHVGHPDSVLSNDSDFSSQKEMDSGNASTSSAHSFNNRDAHVRKILQSREKEFSHIETLRLFVGTWNVNGRPASEDLMPWFKNVMDQPPSIIALGFQELDLSKEALLFSDSVREVEWRQACEEAVRKVSSEVSYKTLEVVRLVGVMLILFIDENLLPHVDGVATGNVPTGIMGFLGNKGGVAVRLTVHNSSLCFITSHLAAHMEQVERRNQDYKDILTKMAFNGIQMDVNANYIPIKKHDMVFWFGDLNYRISDLPIDKVKGLIQDKIYEPLLQHDQLLIEKDHKRAFTQFVESGINFDPTYKYDVGTDVYDTSEKMRVPAWTDRILQRGKNIHPIKYDCHQELMLSDHKPVSHTYDIGVKVIDRDKHRLVYEDVMKQLDKLENEYLPQVTCSPTELDYGEVKFREPVTLSIEIKNTGQVPADFSFIPKLNERSHCKQWMTIRPYRDCILPNETATVELTVFVDNNSAYLLASGDESIEDILVLHLDGGKDFFITIFGKYKLSCFGCSLNTLIQLPNPISETASEHISKLNKNPITDLSYSDEPRSTLPVPKELWFLCDSINSRGKLEEDLFQQRGLHHEIIQIRDSLDTSLNQNLPGNVHSAVETLLHFLEALGDPVIPTELYDDALSAATDRHKSIEVVNRLPPVHKKVFEYLVEFMVELLKYSDKNRLDASTLGNIFGPALIRTHENLQLRKADMELIATRKAMFIQNFLLEPQPPATT